jgi:hypothetical protein
MSPIKELRKVDSVLAGIKFPANTKTTPDKVFLLVQQLKLYEREHQRLNALLVQQQQQAIQNHPIIIHPLPGGNVDASPRVPASQ